MTQQLMPDIPSQQMFDDSRAKQPSSTWLQWFQSLVDLLNRPILNRLSVTLGSSYQSPSNSLVSTGSGIGPITPKRYGEFLILFFAKLLSDTTGANMAAFVYRNTTGIPTAGSAPGGGDAVVLTIEGMLVGTAGAAGLQVPCAGFDSGLGISTPYYYYLAVSTGGSSSKTTLSSGSRLTVMEL